MGRGVKTREHSHNHDASNPPQHELSIQKAMAQCYDQMVKLSPWPMIATLFRIFIVPVVVVLMMLKPTFWAPICCVLFIIASITDWLDGYLARKLNSVSTMGKFLDPMADKILVSSVLIMFIPLGWIEAIAVLLLINRDMLIGGVRSIAASRGQIIAAGNIGDTAHMAGDRHDQFFVAALHVFY